MHSSPCLIQSSPRASCRHAPFVAPGRAGNRIICKASDTPQQPGSAQQQTVSRRAALELAAVLPVLHLQTLPAAAQEALAPSPAAASSSAPAVEPQRWNDVDFQLTVPGQYQYTEIPQPPPPEGAGPAPPANPLKVRFDSPDSEVIVSVLVKQAQLIKPTFFQVSDIAQYGSPQETAQFILPKGSVVVGFSSVQVELPPKTNSLGKVVEVPPKTYYRYDFTTPAGFTVAMSVAAQRGKVYVCSAAAPAARWDTVKPELQQVANSFRLKDAVSLF